jgi:hypothetical protein
MRTLRVLYKPRSELQQTFNGWGFVLSLVSEPRPGAPILLMKIGGYATRPALANPDLNIGPVPESCGYSSLSPEA